MASLIVVFLVVSLIELAPIRRAVAADAQNRDQRQGIEQRIQGELDELGAKTRALEARAQKNGAKDRRVVDRQFRELKAELRTAEAKARQLREASADAWDGIKRDADRAERNARSTYDKLAAKLKSS